jgi:pimeloyl-ACP methyl ester carboxylesterase
MPRSLYLPVRCLAFVAIVSSLAACTSAVASRDDHGGEASTHGALISAERIDAPPGAQAWRVRYVSQRANGDAVPVTGVVIAPRTAAPSGGFPVITWGHGLSGAADRCAPSSRTDLVGNAVPSVALAMRVVIVATDYAGLGTPGLPETGVGESEGRNMLDIALAAGSIRGLDVSPTTIVSGDSMGGHAALFAGQMASTYAPSLDLAGVLVTAPAAMPRDLLASLPSSSYLGYALEAAVGYARAYDLDVGELLTRSARSRLEVVRRDCADAVLAAFASDRASDAFVRDPETVPAWRDAIRANTPGATAIGAPVLVLQGTDDPIVPVESTDRLVRRLRAAGDEVAYHVLPGVGHEPLEAAPTEIVAWIARALAAAS